MSECGLHATAPVVEVCEGCWAISAAREAVLLDRIQRLTEGLRAILTRHEVTHGGWCSVHEDLAALLAEGDS